MEVFLGVYQKEDWINKESKDRPWETRQKLMINIMAEIVDKLTMNVTTPNADEVVEKLDHS